MNDKIRDYLKGKITDFKGYSRNKMNAISNISFTLKDGTLIQNAQILDMDKAYNKDTYELTILVKYHTIGSPRIGETEILRQYCKAPVGCKVDWASLHCNIEFGSVGTREIGSVEYIRSESPEA